MILKKTIYNDDKNYAPREGEQIFGPNENRSTAESPIVQAQMAREDAAKASKRASEAVKAAGEAAEIANAVSQKVWSDDSGLHISDGNQDAAATRNTIWNSLGMLFRRGLNPILGILTGNNPRVVVYDGNGSDPQNEVASFGSTAVVGQALNGKTRTVTAPEGVDLLRRENGSDVTLAHFGYDYGTPKEEGQPQVENPYYTFGYRSPDYAVGNWSFAEGDWPVASGFASHAEGSEPMASGLASHAGGVRTVASGTASHAGGWETTASGDQSFAHGYQVQADFNQEFVIGRFNNTSLTPYINTIYVCDENDYDKATLTFPNTYGTYEGDFVVTYNGNFLPSPQCIYVTSTTITIVAAPLSSSGDGHFEDGDEIGVILSASFPAFVIGNGDTTHDSNALSICRNGDVHANGDVYVWCNADSSGGKAIGEQNVLWSGAWFMDASHTAKLSERVSDQLTGIVLIWSYYTNGAAQNYGWHSTFVPKGMVELHNGVGWDVELRRTKNVTFGTKYVYVNDDRIVGHADNVATGTENNVPYANNKWVLRYVFGC